MLPMNNDCRQIGEGFFFEDFIVGSKFRTFGRTITEADLVNFVNATGFTEVLFTNTEFLKKAQLSKAVLCLQRLSIHSAKGSPPP